MTLIMIKRIIGFVLPLIVVGCVDKSEPNPPSQDITHQQVIFGWDGGNKTVEIPNSNDWVIASELPDWLQLSVAEKWVDITVSLNESQKQRSAIVIVFSTKYEYTLNITQSAKPILEFEGEKRDTLSSEACLYEVGIRSNVRFKIDILDDGIQWIRQSDKGADGMISGHVISDVRVTRFDVSSNTSLSERTARLIISADKEGLSDTLYLVQRSGGYHDDDKNDDNGNDNAEDEGKDDNQEENEGWYADGDVITLQFSENANAELVFMGDGFTNKDLSVNGKYEVAVKTAIEHFFSIEPYNTYADYFNIYMVVAESEKEGVGIKGSLGGSFRNKFGSAYGAGTEIICNEDTVFEYARKPITISDNDKVTAIVILNSDKYAGTAYLYDDGNSIALCPMSSQEFPYDFRGIVQHEAGGHAFGYLADEYVYYDQEMPKSRIDYMLGLREEGFYLNLDFTDDPEKVLWKGFFGLDGYEMVGLFEGGYEYQYGVWRSEENSCMNNNIPYFNAQSRWAIYSRLMNLSGYNTDFEFFIKNDRQQTDVRHYAMKTSTEFIPLAPPVIRLSQN